ncbi:CDP-diacylglycerol--glycerol-3-phosphate 3-phosphatidyltransferase [Candidatus Woesearchaeota archaeon]|nr:MAG: CDP-diacylglycerol--glycerol-3-phosphate 3-phosphatidyltransferase [Candidatus Woesearchaeota archaeon]
MRRRAPLWLFMRRADVLTLIRGLLVIPILLAFLFPSPWAAVAGIVLFTLGVLTDYLDGFFARKDGPTKEGKILDPLVDKILILSILVVYVYRHVFPLTPFLIILIRDLSMNGLRTLSKKPLAANLGGKAKTVIEMVLVYALFATDLSFRWRHLSLLIVSPLAWLAAAAAVLSFAHYLTIIVRNQGLPLRGVRRRRARP